MSEEFKGPLIQGFRIAFALKANLRQRDEDVKVLAKYAEELKFKCPICHQDVDAVNSGVLFGEYEKVFVECFGCGYQMQFGIDNLGEGVKI